MRINKNSFRLTQWVTDMGTLHYGIVQQKHRNWFTIATFEFDKDYELFRWLHSQKSRKLYPRDIVGFESLDEPYDDMHCYQVFFEDDLFVDGQLMAVFRYDDTYPERKGQSSFIYEAMIQTFILVPGEKRIVICQDQ